MHQPSSRVRGSSRSRVEEKEGRLAASLRACLFAACAVLAAVGCGPLEESVDDEDVGEAFSELGGSTPCTSTQDGVCEGTLTITSQGKLSYYRTHAIGQKNAAVTHAVIAIHGISRSHGGQFDAVVRAAKSRGTINETLVLAPKFALRSDDVPSGYLYWPDSGWKEGDAAEAPGTISSFAVMDEILRRVLDPATFPNIERVTVIGHSAGGQFAQRYAAGGRVTSSTVDIRYIVSNPSSYMYLNEQRPDGRGGWTVPSTSCRYDRYRYGLVGRNAYMAGLSDAELRTRFVSRKVVYFMGEDDTLRDADLDVSCGADFQGRNRLERGRNFASHVARFYKATHELVTAPDVGHSASRMYTSPAGQKLLFP